MKQSTPGKARPTASPGSVEELRAQSAALRKENRELARANAILPPGARTENLASTCILQTCALEVGAAHKIGAPLPYAELAEAEHLAEHLLSRTQTSLRR